MSLSNYGEWILLSHSAGGVFDFHTVKDDVFNEIVIFQGIFLAICCFEFMSLTSVRESGRTCIHPGDWARQFPRAACRVRARRSDNPSGAPRHWRPETVRHAQSQQQQRGADGRLAGRLPAFHTQEWKVRANLVCWVISCAIVIVSSWRFNLPIGIFYVMYAFTILVLTISEYCIDISAFLRGSGNDHLRCCCVGRVRSLGDVNKCTSIYLSFPSFIRSMRKHSH